MEDIKKKMVNDQQMRTSKCNVSHPVLGSDCFQLSPSSTGQIFGKGFDTKYQMCESRTKEKRDLVVLMSVFVILYNRKARSMQYG